MNELRVNLNVIIKKLKRDRSLRRSKKNEKLSFKKSKFTLSKRRRIDNIIDYE